VTATIVPLNTAPNLNDIPSQFRQLADRLEAEPTDALVILIPGPDNDWPSMFNYGRYLGNHETLGLFELAKVRTIDLARTPEVS